MAYGNNMYSNYRNFAKGGIALMGTQYSGGVSNRQNQRFKRSMSYTRTTGKRGRSAGGFTSSVKRVVKSMEEAKHLTLSDTQLVATGLGFTHNTILSNMPTGLIAQGTNIQQRIGDSVDLCALKINGYLYSHPATTAPVQYRIIVGFSTLEINPGPILGSAIGTPDVFFPSTGLGNITSSIINPKAFTVLDDRKFLLNDNLNGTSITEDFIYTVQLNRKHDYKSGGSVFGKVKNLYIICMASIQNGVSGTTLCGTVAMSADLIYKEL